MKILHVFDHSIPLHSGYTFRSRAILEHQRKLGWETDHLTGPKHNEATQPESDEETIDDLHFFRTDMPTGFCSKLPVVNQWSIVAAIEKRLLEIIPQINPDIIHAHSPVLNGLAAVRVGKKLEIPVVYEIRAFWEDAAVDHGTTKENSLRYNLTKAIETYVARNTDHLTTICEGLRSDLITRGIPENKITVIPNAVDISKFNSGRAVDSILQEQLELDNSDVIGFIGSFYAYEGLSLLINSIPDILTSLPNVKLLLVGGGPQEENLKNQVAQLGLTNTIIFTGRVPHDQVKKYYDLVDVFVYPRLSMRLTELVTPLKPLEAMAQKRLVVASNVGGHKELIEDNKNGILFLAGDKQSLAKTVVDLFSRKQDWAKLHNEGRQYVEKIRSWPISVANYKKVYHLLCKKTKK